MPRVLIAPDKFKGSLSAAAVAAAVGRGVLAVAPGAGVVALPVADGGDGTVDAALAAGYVEVPVTATGPTGDPVSTRYARHGDLAVVELADVSGLGRLPDGRWQPMTASSRGTGEVLAAAVEAGCRRVVLGIGGSACTDGGAGMLRALGARMRDAQGQEIPDGGEALAALQHLDLDGLRERMTGVAVTVACDVDNPLTGPTGAARVYGPQKGADPAQVAVLDTALGGFADLVAGVVGADLRDSAGAGAAGGVGFAAVTVLDARLRPGIDLVLDLVGFHEQLASADLVVTGEGALDRQTLHGKAPAGVAAAARAAGVPVLAVCGTSTLEPEQLAGAGLGAAYALTDLEPDLQRCQEDPEPLLERIGRRIAEEHLRTDPAAGTMIGTATLEGSAEDTTKGATVERPPDLVIRAHRAVTPTGEAARAVAVRDGRIVAVDPLDAPSPEGDPARAGEVRELADDEVLLPGLVDAHVHVNDPGRTEWEGFATATRAAAAGGITTIVDMPLNSIPPTVDVDALQVKRKAAEGRIYGDVGFWGGAVPGNVEQLRPLHAAGVSGFKCFLLHSGVDEFPPLDAAQLEEAMTEIASFDGLLIVHAEDAETIAGAPEAQGRRYDDFLRSRPADAETTAIGQVIEAARRTGCRVHVLHLSSAQALPMIAEARRSGLRLTVETCPHYLTFTAEEVPDGATPFKCCPPIRDAANRDRLWQGLADGLIDTIVSDHSPCVPELKLLEEGDFGEAWGGVSSLQLGLSAVWTEARARGFTLADVVRWMATGTAEQADLPAKGRLDVGADADLTVLAPDETFVVDAARLRHRHPVTPYADRTLTGTVRRTWLRGQPLDIDAEPRGRFLTRGEA